GGGAVKDRRRGLCGNDDGQGCSNWHGIAVVASAGRLILEPCKRRRACADGCRPSRRSLLHRSKRKTATTGMPLAASPAPRDWCCQRTSPAWIRQAGLRSTEEVQ